ncbi:MAG: DNA primase [Bifidobacteriaceae bacterium]|jgi:DNA primase|nr:DNA primase [Bifidobacteriaceae bacterium]
MSGVIGEKQIAEIKARVRIEDVVGKYVALKSSGSGRLKGLCPFHEEKTASFQVSTDQGSYYCFGCGEHGDAIEFLRKINGMDFKEAVEFLAQIVGIQIVYQAGRVQNKVPHIWGNLSERTGIILANSTAHQYFQNFFWSSAGGLAQQFLRDRHFSDAQIKKFEVGFIPNQWDNLSRYMQSKGWTAEQLIRAGLSLPSQKGGVHDRFRGRVIWPIKDLTGSVVGFGGRKIFNDEHDTAKFINTPETPVYKKSKVLYALDLARKSMGLKKQAVIVEGYADVMAMHLAEIDTAVAPCGTAFTVDQAKILRRLVGDYVDNETDLVRQVDNLGAEIIFVFDGDEAGQKAARRAYRDDQVFMAKTYVCIVPNQADPADLWVQHGPKALLDLLEHKMPMFEFMLRSIIARFDKQFDPSYSNLNDSGIVRKLSAESQAQIVTVAAPILKGIQDVVLRAQYIKKLQAWILVDEDIINMAVEQAKVNQIERSFVQNPPSSSPTNTQNISSVSDRPLDLNEDSYDDFGPDDWPDQAPPEDDCFDPPPSPSPPQFSVVQIGSVRNLDTVEAYNNEIMRRKNHLKSLPQDSPQAKQLTKDIDLLRGKKMKLAQVNG